MKDILVTIVKDNKLTNINADALYPGDTVILQAGELIPADLYLVESRSLEVDEFDITGEIMPVFKNVTSDNQIYAGSKILKGYGKGIVVATGNETEYGKLLTQTSNQSKTIPIDRLHISYFISVALLLPGFLYLSFQLQQPVIVMSVYFFLAILLVVIQHQSLFRFLYVSKALKKYERHQIEIRDASVLETLNKIDIFCFDKTGVLTSRQITVKNIFSAENQRDMDSSSENQGTIELIKIGCALCNDVLFFEKIDQANAIDKALLSFSVKNGIQINTLLLNTKRIFDLPFDSENRYMACGFDLANKPAYFAKGDPEIILKLCTTYFTQSGMIEKLESNLLLSIRTQVDALNASGSTTIALAYTADADDGIPNAYTFLCLCQLESPLQAGAVDVIKALSGKGIRSIMLTGDRSETAMNVSNQTGIADGTSAFLAGKVMAQMPMTEVANRALTCSVFPRLLPSQKAVIIRLLQQKGHHVAMIGDGANDGIALKVADLGFSFQSNSSPIAKRLSKILINDLSELIVLFESSEKVHKKMRNYDIFRILFIILTIIVLYGYIIYLIR